MTHTANDYMSERDLNTATGGPVTSPLDPRAMHYFGFLSDAQQISLVQPFAGQPRVLISFHYGNQPTAAPIQPPPPIDAVLDFSGGPPIVERRDHRRAHVLVWLDPANVPPAGQPAVVRITAQARE